MIKIYYTQERNGAVLYYDCPSENRMDAVRWLLNKGYEIVGES